MIENTGAANFKRNYWWIAIGSALLAVLATLLVLLWAGWLRMPQAGTQAAIHDMGSHVMPFDLEKTTHIFQMTESGGVQQVIAKDPADSA